MGAVTGKGLSDLIREEFGLRTTFFMMAALVLANFTNMMADFAGIASSLELFHISRYISVPLGAVGGLVSGGEGQLPQRGEDLPVCLLRVRHLHRFRHSGEAGLERSGDLQREARADAGQRLHHMLIGMVGTSIAPWMQFYLQAAVVEKGITAKEYVAIADRSDRGLHCMTDVIAFFIIVACAGAIWRSRRAISKMPPMPRWR